LYDTHDESDSDEIRITYINVNVLLDANHIRDLESDINLTASDILCIAETKIDQSVPNGAVEIQGFDIVSRIDYREKSIGMLLYGKKDHSLLVHVHSVTTHESPKSQTMCVAVDGLRVLFAYLHPETSNLGLLKVGELLTDEGDILKADLNIDCSKDVDRKKIDMFAEEHLLHVLALGPTCKHAHLDHILIPD
jgi:hypothetical protein